MMALASLGAPSLSCFLNLSLPSRNVAIAIRTRCGGVDAAGAALAGCFACGATATGSLNAADVPTSAWISAHVATHFNTSPHSLLLLVTELPCIISFLTAGNGGLRNRRTLGRTCRNTRGFKRGVEISSIRSQVAIQSTPERRGWLGRTAIAQYVLISCFAGQSDQGRLRRDHGVAPYRRGVTRRTPTARYVRHAA
jgi:hypothetical protein